MNDDDKLLRTLGALGAEEERDGQASKWERLLRGELSPEEVRELERLAEKDPDTAMLLSAHRPLGEDARARIVSDLEEHVAAPAKPEARKAEVLTHERWRPRAYAFAGTLALAAGIALLVTRRGGPELLPPYALDVSGASLSRGPADPSRPAGACVLHASARGSFELLARTEQPGAGAIAAHAFLVHDGAAVPWTGALEISASGSVRIADSAQRLVGASELRVTVGRRDELAPEKALEKARAGASAGPGWQVLSCAITPAAD